LCFSGNFASFFELGGPDYIVKSTTFKSWVFYTLYVFEITLYTIDMHKNRFLSSNNQPPPIYRLTTAVSDIDQTNINRDIRDVYTRPFFTLKNHFENWTFHCTLHFWHCKKRRHCLWGGRLQKNWAAQFLLSHQLTQAFSGESETAPMILNSFQTFLYYAYLSRKTQCSGRLLEHRGRKIYNFPTFYVISNDVVRLLATFWTSQSTHGTDS